MVFTQIMRLPNVFCSVPSPSRIQEERAADGDFDMEEDDSDVEMEEEDGSDVEMEAVT